MVLNFINNDYISNVLVFVKKDISSGYYFCDKENWILEWWDFDNSLNTTIEEQQFDFIQKFKVDLESLKTHSKDLINSKRVSDLQNNLPCIYVDFDKKVFISTYYEQALEKRMIDGWTGKFEPFLEFIPDEYKYWIVDNKDYSEISTNVQ